MLTRTLESRPEAATHWSTRDMAKACGLSRSTVSPMWRALSLALPRSESFKLSRDPLIIEKLRDIVGLYLAPPNRALVLCVDEKSQIGVPGKRYLLAGVEMGALDRRAAAADAVRTDRAADRRLRPPRHDKPLGRARHPERQGHRPAPAEGSLWRVPQLRRHDREERARGTGRSPHPGTTTAVTKHRRSATGWPSGPASICTSRRARPHGSAWSNAGSPCSPKTSPARSSPFHQGDRRRRRNLHPAPQPRPPSPSSGGIR